MKPKRAIIPQGVRFDVFRRDNFTCVYCGASSPDVVLECDHKVPVAKGGKDDQENLVTACFDCNRGKSAKDAPNRPTPAGKPAHRHPLIGMFGHGIDEQQRFTWQFEITGVVDGFASLQLFSWLDGRPTDVKLVAVAELADAGKFALYASEDEWLRQAEKSTAAILQRA
jgi:hypothetical protein